MFLVEMLRQLFNKTLSCFLENKFCYLFFHGIKGPKTPLVSLTKTFLKVFHVSESIISNIKRRFVYQLTSKTVLVENIC